MIANIQKLEEESNTATHKPLFQAEADISCLKKKYEDLFEAADEQLTDMKNPVCSFEFEQDSFLSGLIELSNEVEKKETPKKRSLCKSHSQSMNNGNDSSSPDLEADRPNTAANHISSNTPTLSSPEKKQRFLLREYSREPIGHNRSTPTLDKMPCTKEHSFEKNGKRDKIKNVTLERGKSVNGEAPFLRKSIQTDKVVIQTNYPNYTPQNSFCSPQLPNKSSSMKANRMLKRINGEMEGSAVGLGVRRVNSLDPTEIIDSSRSQKYRQNENHARREPLRRLDNNDALEGSNNLNDPLKTKNNKMLLAQSYKAKKSDSRSVREMMKSLSVNSKQKNRLGETNI
eukprot:TRINITY_DN10822_c0_g2_i2.p1 TRINITY_DN10822_c0_g2~~TRINITY_DN10822_c0_g2_i2.p1  ORF type:complete len:343 (+),score=78.54 TRINITY_DN10822_c0_g2_i2:1236-2264(+)